MKLFYCTLILILAASLSKSQILETKAAQSPAIFASSISVSYGIESSIIIELIEIFKQKGLSQKARKIEVAKLASKYSKAQNEMSIGQMSTDEIILSKITSDREIANILIKTSGISSPAIYAMENATVSYGISEELFWNLYDILDQQNVDAKNWHNQFVKLLSELNELKKKLSDSQNEMALEAKKLIEEGKFQEAKEVLRNRIYFVESKEIRLKKEKASAYADFAQIFKIEQILDSSLIYYSWAIKLDPNNTDLAYELGLIYLDWRKNDSAIYWLNHSLKVDTLKVPSKSIAASNRYRHIGLAYEVMGKHDKALHFLLSALSIDTLHYGSFHPKIGSDFVGIGQVYNSLGKFDRAKFYFRKAYEIDSAFQGIYEVNISEKYLLLGSVFENLGKYDSAIFLYKKAIALDSIKFGIEHPQVAVGFNNLGKAYEAIGEFLKAIFYIKKALAIDSQIYNIQHPRIATFYNNLGSVYRTIGSFDSAHDYFQLALNIDTIAYGNHHPIIAIIYNNLGSSFFAKGDFDQAVNSFKKALVINTRLFQSKHPLTARIHKNLGTTYASLKLYDDALIHLYIALEMDKEIHGLSHRSIARDYNSIGSTYKRIENYDKGIFYLHKALSVDTIVFGLNHPTTATHYNNLGSILDSKGEFEKAIFYFNNALVIDSSSFEVHPSIARDLNNLGGAYRSLGRYKLAFEYCDSAFQIVIKFFPEEHPNLYAVLMNLSHSANSVGLKYYSEAVYDSAKHYFKIALQRAVQAGNSSFMFICNNNIGYSCTRLAEFDSAIIFYNQGLSLVGSLKQSRMESYHNFQYPILIMNNHVVQNNEIELTHIRLELIMSKVKCLFKQGNKNEAKMILKTLKKHAIKNEDKELLKKIKTQKRIYRF